MHVRGIILTSDLRAGNGNSHVRLVSGLFLVPLVKTPPVVRVRFARLARFTQVHDRRQWILHDIIQLSIQYISTMLHISRSPTVIEC